MDQLNELYKLIDFILEQYYSINADWESNSLYKPINMKNKKVHNLIEDNELSDIVYNYRNFINNYYSDIYTSLQGLNLTNEVEMRIKANNSLQDKIYRYCSEEKHEYGHIPINKCVNDLIGFRLIFSNDVDLVDIISYINNRYDNVVCINSSKDAYIATHVYVVSNDNYMFRWELQLWNKSDYYNNKESHEKYKQEYTKYEYELKEEEQNG